MTNPTPTEQLAAIRAVLAGWRKLCDGATAGPWTYTIDPLEDSGIYWNVECPGETDGAFMHVATIGRGKLGLPDVQFIAASRTLTPALLDGYDAILAQAEADLLPDEWIPVGIAAEDVLLRADDKAAALIATLYEVLPVH